jgi:cysteinyl-tRNA synthetase
VRSIDKRRTAFYAGATMPPTPILLFNSMGRELQEFTPLAPGSVRLYTCGLTVYNYAHLGNLRAYLFTDTLRRVLQWKGLDVLHVMNITDVGHLTSDADEGQDKMEMAASRGGRTVWEIAAYYTREFKADCEQLNILPPAVWCKATDHIQEMVDFSRAIERRGYTYVLDDGLYFDTAKVKDYGRLGLLDVQGQREGARVAVKEGKRSPNDFVVWRRSPTDRQRLMEWHSPWGVGAPGWHLECSVMSLKYLGHRFDIHTGGVDHRQVHHVNEIAQNQAFLGDDELGARFWMHNEFLILNEEKMSKSSGEFLRLKTLVDRGIHPLAYRYFALQASYRSPLEFSTEALISAHAGFTRLLRRVEAIRDEAGRPAWLGLLDETRYSSGGSLAFVVDQLREGLPPPAGAWVEKLDAAISNDLNTPQVMGHLAELVGEEGLAPDATLRLVALYDLVLGLRLLSLRAADTNVRPATVALDDARIDALIQEREAARKARDFRRADEIRQRLTDAGVALKDTPDGTVWEWIPR